MSLIGRNSGTTVLDSKAIGYRINTDCHVWTSVFDSVSKEILQQLLESVWIGCDCRKFRIVRMLQLSLFLFTCDHSPSPLSYFLQFYGLSLADIFSFSGEPQHVVDDPVHSVECLSYCLVIVVFSPFFREL